jgi:hypothetical protein
MSSNWEVGQRIRTGENLWEVTEVYPEQDELEILVLDMSGAMEQFLDYDRKYRLEKIQDELWKVPQEFSKTPGSTVGLSWWHQGPVIEIDF